MNNPASIGKAAPPQRFEQPGSMVRSNTGTATKTETIRGKVVSIRKVVSIKGSPNASQIAGDYHILFGRGRACNENPGNQRMRRIVNKYKSQYSGAGTRAVKRRIVRKAYDEIVEGGVMFLKKVGNDKWVQVEDEVAIDKVSHSLRCRKGDIEVDTSTQESPEMSGAQDSKPASSSHIIPPAIIPRDIMAPPEVIHRHQVPSASSATQSFEGGEVLRHTVNQQQAPLDEDHDSLLTRSLLIRQLQIERMRTDALIRSLRFVQRPSVTLELETLRAMERRDEEVRLVLASRGNMFPGI